MHEGPPSKKPETGRKTYYEILNVAPDANEGEIKKAYRILAVTHHPDHGGNPQKFSEVNEAYRALTNPEKRTAYNLSINADKKSDREEIFRRNMNEAYRMAEEQRREKVERDFERHSFGLIRNHRIMLGKVDKAKGVETLTQRYKELCEESGISPDESFFIKTLESDGWLDKKESGKK